MKHLSLILFATIISFASCKKTEEETPEPATTREASFKIGATTYTDPKPYLGIFDDNGTIKNTLYLDATDGSKIKFYFKGASPATYPLVAYPDAVYTTVSGKNYNAFVGTLVVSAYSSSSSHIMSGTFSFKARAISSPYDTVEVTNGIITNASNEL